MSNNAIEVHDLRRQFGELTALDGVSFGVPSGTVFGLLGPNGAGKTTAVRILTTIIKPTGGSARILGYDVVRDATAVRYRIGLAGQYAAVDGNLTGRENLRLIGRLTQLPGKRVAARADELLARFQLQDAGDRTVRTYSGGMRRRLDLAAALVHQPPVLFLDEPTTGLDPSGRLELWDVIRELVSDGTTVLLTTQYLEEADHLASHIVVINHGRIIAEGTPAQLKARVGATVIEIGFADEGAAAQARSAVVPFDEGAELDGRSLRLKMNDGASVLIDILRSLDSAGLSPATINVREPSLDDAFLALTGHATAEPPGPEPEPALVEGGSWPR